MICRVHWLLWHLPVEFKANYRLIYDYSKHCYFFYRMIGNTRKIRDCFIVVRTSKHCFRVAYMNAMTLDFQAFTVPKSLHAAHRMWYIYKIDDLLYNKNPM